MTNQQEQKSPELERLHSQFPIVTPEQFLSYPIIQELAPNERWTISDDRKRPLDAVHLLTKGEQRSARLDGANPLTSLYALDTQPVLYAVNRAYRLHARDNRVMMIDVEPEASNELKARAFDFPAHFTELSRNGGVHLLIRVPEDCITPENRYLFDELSVLKEPVPTRRNLEQSKDRIGRKLDDIVKDLGLPSAKHIEIKQDVQALILPLVHDIYTTQHAMLEPEKQQPIKKDQQEREQHILTSIKERVTQEIDEALTLDLTQKIHELYHFTKRLLITTWQLDTYVERQSAFEVLFNDHYITFTKRVVMKQVADFENNPRDREQLVAFLDFLVEMDKENRENRELARAYNVQISEESLTPERQEAVQRFIDLKVFDSLRPRFTEKTLEDFGGNRSNYEMSVASTIAYQIIRIRKLASESITLRDDVKDIGEQEMIYATYKLLEEIVPARDKHEEERDGLVWLLYTAKRAYEFVSASNEAKKKEK